MKINILLYLQQNILLLNLIDLYIYDYQILNLFSINGFAGIRGIVPTFLSTSWLLQVPPGPHPRKRERIICIKRVIYLQNMNYASCFVQKCIHTCMYIHVKSIGIWIKLRKMLKKKQ